MTSVCLITNSNVDGSQFPDWQSYHRALDVGCGSLNDIIYKQLNQLGMHWSHHVNLNADDPLALRSASGIVGSRLCTHSVTVESRSQQENYLIEYNDLSQRFAGVHRIYQRKLIANAAQFWGFLHTAHLVLEREPLQREPLEWDYFVRIRPDLRWHQNFTLADYLRPGGDYLVEAQHPALCRVAGLCQIQHPCAQRTLFVRDQFFVMTPSAIRRCYRNVRPWLVDLLSDMERHWDISVERPYADDRWYNETALGRLLAISNVAIQPAEPQNPPGVLLRSHHLDNS